MSARKFLFPLKQLRIGHFQSHLSHLSLLLTPESAGFYILVDNSPWVAENVERLHRWLSFIQTPPHTNSVVSNFIVLQVSWNDVRGLNYLNQLQTDTSLAIEARFMNRWDFDSTSQAATCVSSWFDGTQEEENIIKDFLHIAIGGTFHYDGESIFSTDSTGEGSIHGDNVSPENSDNISGSSSVVQSSRPTEYPFREPQTPLLINSNVTRISNVFILAHFDDRDLQFILKDKFMSNPWLLILLESGLPSWVIFLQSQPGINHLYFPWMYLLVRILYVMISFVTFLIGFNDLYKVIPILKTVYWIIGPLLNWVETWGMISRIRYLGTMLFLQNFQTAFEYLLTITRTARMSFSGFYGLYKNIPILKTVYWIIRPLLDWAKTWGMTSRIRYLGTNFQIAFKWLLTITRAARMGLSRLYDLYKNIPILNTVYYIIGLLFDWVDTWGIISRIKYLGTVLFLQNIQRAFEWLLMITRTARSFILMFTQPVARQLWENIGFLLPSWVWCVNISVWLNTIISMIYLTTLSLFSYLVGNLLRGIYFFLSLFQTHKSSFIIPAFWIKGTVSTLYLLLLRVVNFVAPFYTSICECFAEVWLLARRILRISTANEANLGTGQASLLQTVWNDFYSQIFPPVRRISKGLCAFSATFKRYQHRYRTLIFSTQKGMQTYSYMFPPPSSINNHLRGRKFDRHQASPSTDSEHSNLTTSTSSEHSDITTEARSQPT